MKKEFAGLGLEEAIILGVVNLSPETFYKGSLVQGKEEVVDRVRGMVEDGAQMVDLGGMSTGPSVEPISVEEEKRRLLPAVEAVSEELDVPISVDTQRAEVADEALELGADVINDVSGFKADPGMAEVAADHGCHAILMASGISGRVRTAEKEAGDIADMDATIRALEGSLGACRDHDFDLERVAVDPSIGFGRSREEDLAILSRLEEMEELRRPICIGVSRKSSLGGALGLDSPSERLPASLGATAVAVQKGAKIVRTHDPAETLQAVRMVEAILDRA